MDTRGTKTLLHYTFKNFHLIEEGITLVFREHEAQIKHHRNENNLFDAPLFLNYCSE